MSSWYGKHKQSNKWKTRDTRTLYLTFVYTGWLDFVDKSGIEDNETNKLIFETLYVRFGNVYLIYNTSDFINSNLKYHIEQKGLKYDKLKQMYDKEIKYFESKINDITQYKVGDIETNTEDEPKYKAGSQITNDTDLIENYNKAIKNLESPLTGIIKEIANMIFNPLIKIDIDSYEF